MNSEGKTLMVLVLYDKEHTDRRNQFFRCSGFYEITCKNGSSHKVHSLVIRRPTEQRKKRSSKR